jgi:hypothetical protein
MTRWSHRRARRAAAAILGVALLGAGCSDGSRDTTALAHQRPAPLSSAPVSPAASITLPGGATRQCPHGTEPSLIVSAATFAPTLTGGTTFAARRYHVTIRGVVANDTSDPIRIGSVTPLVAGRPWAARVMVAPSVPARSSVGLVVDGSYDSPRAQQARIDSRLRWSWADPGLRSCGTTGLVEDD